MSPVSAVSYVSGTTRYVSGTTRACQNSVVKLCKRDKFQGFPVFRSILRPEILKFGIAIRRRFPVSFNDLRTLRGFEVLWATGCKFSGDEGLSLAASLMIPIGTDCARVIRNQIGLSNIIRQRFAGFECRDADRQVAEHSRDRSAIGAAYQIAIVFPEALAISGIIVLIRLAFRYLHIAPRFDLGFPLRFALSFKRRDVARVIREDDGWAPPDGEHGRDSKPSAIPRNLRYVQTHPILPIQRTRFGKLLVTT
jgi:hypothetical protein